MAKTQTTTIEMGRGLFASALVTAGIGLSNKKQLDNVGLQGDDDILLIELLLLRLHAIMKGVLKSELAPDVRTAIIEEVHASFSRWLSDELKMEPQSVYDMKKQLVDRYKDYAATESAMGAGDHMKAQQILLESLREVLSPTVTADDVFTTFPLMSMFFELINAHSKGVQELLSPMDIVLTDNINDLGGTSL